jgi:hypothetical protein
MFPGGNPSSDMNIYFALSISTLLKTSQKKAVKSLRLKSKREVNFLCTPSQASAMIFPKGRHPMVGTDDFINAISEEEPPIIRGDRNLF